MFVINDFCHHFLKTLKHQKKRLFQILGKLSNFTIGPPYAFYFCLLSADRRLLKMSCTKGAVYCFFRKVVENNFFEKV